MIDFVKSSELKKYISAKIQKNIQDITVEDLDKINDIHISGVDFLGNKKDYDFEDLLYFKNLKRCSISNYEITEKEVQILNRLSDVKFIEFSYCTFESGNIKMNSLESIYFDKCYNVPFYNIDFSNIKNFYINSFLDNKGFIDISTFNSISSFENISINNCMVENIDFFLNCPRLTSINLDGSINYNNDIVENLKGKNINVSTKSFHILS